jgi:hypothetical protein
VDDGIYVMWSGSRRLSKVGLSVAPHARASQLRRERADDTIRLMTCWNLHSSGSFLGAQNLELYLHESLREAGFQDPSNPFPSEWFTLHWTAAAEWIEQCAQLLAPMGVRLSRAPGNHGK